MKFGGGWRTVWNRIFNKEISIIVVTEFWYIAIFAIFYALKKCKVMFPLFEDFSLDGGTLLNHLFGVFRGNWYIVCYIAFLWTVPFMNLFLNELSKRQFQTLLVLIALLWIIIPTLTFNSIFHYITGSFAVFYCTYPFGAYIKKYGLGDACSRKKDLVLAAICIAVMWLSVVFIDLVGFRINNSHMIECAQWLQEYNTIPSFLLGYSVFQFARKGNLKSNAIDFAAGSVIGVYLIHLDPLVSQLIWRKILPNADWQYSAWLPVHMIVKVLAVFFICLLLDIIRRMTIHRLFLRWQKKYSNRAFEHVYSAVSHGVNRISNL